MNDFTTFCVSFNDGSGTFSLSKTYRDDLVTWTEVMEDFIGFLSKVYGYDISDRVVLKRSAVTLPSASEENYGGSA